MEEIPTDPAPRGLFDAYDAAIDELVAIEREMAALEARRAVALDEARRAAQVAFASGGVGTRSDQLAYRSFRLELACALRCSELTVERLVSEAYALTVELPATLQALREGRISRPQASLIVGAAVGFEDAQARDGFERQAVLLAAESNPARLRARLRDLRERMHPVPIEQRHAQAAEARRAWVDPADDGMAYLTGFMTAVDAVAVMDRLRHIASVLLEDPGETRTRQQLESDLMRDLLLGNPYDEGSHARGIDVGRFQGIRPVVFVTVPAMTLLGRNGDEPAVLEGYGPIDDQTARELTANAPSLYRLLTHPHTGARLDLGRDTYRIPADLRMWLRVRDGTCRAPGCGRAAEYCDIDHTLPWQEGGVSAHDNLAHLCPAHHVLKHGSRWSIVLAEDGSITWTSPLGRQYTTQPSHRLTELPRAS